MRRLPSVQSGAVSAGGSGAVPSASKIDSNVLFRPEARPAWFGRRDRPGTRRKRPGNRGGLAQRAGHLIDEDERGDPLRTEQIQVGV